MAQPSLKVVAQKEKNGAPANESAEQALYEVRRKIYPRAVRGWFAAWRWVLVWATQLVFYGGAWLTWNARQALLFDIATRKFYIFGLVFWPQDIIYLTVLLIISALSLFLFTAVAGRLWCGYACPQTVYTEIFLWIEKLIEGDRVGAHPARPVALRRAQARAQGRQARRLDRAVAVDRLHLRRLLHADPRARARGADVLGRSLGDLLDPVLRLRHLRQRRLDARAGVQVHVPVRALPERDVRQGHPDHHLRPRTRRAARRPRAPQADPKALGLGDCVDCGICVQVCPTGIDIRNGLQYECIGCAACIDGCNQVMDRMGYPHGLIRYSTTHAMDNRLTRKQMFARAFRPRVLLYSAVLWAIIIAAGVALYLRVPLKLDVIGDRTVISREVEGGEIENLYQLQIMNTAERAHRFEIRVEGLPTIRVASEAIVELPGATTRLVPVRVRVQPGSAQPGSHRIEFELRALDGDHEHVEEKSVFIIR